MKKTLLIGAVAAASLFGVACFENRDADRGTGGSGNVEEPRLGDGKIGQENGVVDDGEGPLEGQAGEADDKIGNKPGVINDGEGPIEERRDGKIGDREGVIDDGEGPLEENKDLNR